MRCDDRLFQINLIKGTKELEEFLRKKLTRKGLDVLCAKQKPEDLQRIRANLQNNYSGVSKRDAEYMKKHGEWVDISLLVNAKGPTFGGTMLTMPTDVTIQVEVARAITSIASKHSVSDLLSLNMPAAILKKTIEMCSETRFAKISQDVLFALFDHNSAEVRKSAAILAVRALQTKRVKTILREYVTSGKSRYYNVTHWLDLGASMRRDDVRKVARMEGR